MKDTSDWRADARRRYDERSTGGRFKLTEGENSIRILPGVRDDGALGGAPFAEYAAHPNVGPDERFVTCGKDPHGRGECWLCDVQLPELRESGRASSRRRARDMEPRSQFVYQVAWLGSSGEFLGPATWTIPVGGPRALSTQVLGILSRGKRPFEHPVKGANINIERTGSGLKTRYGALIPDMESSRVPEEILSRMKPLSELFRPYDEDVMQAAYHGRDLPERDEDPEDYRSSGRRVDDEEDDRKPPRKKARKAARYEDPEDDDDEDDEDEEVRKPRSRKSAASTRKSRRYEEDDEEDDEDDGEEEEEVRKPRKKTHRKLRKPVRRADPDDDEDDSDDDGDDEPYEDPKPRKRKASKKRKVAREFADLDDEDDEDIPF